MRPLAVAVAVATLAMSAVACGPKSPDFQSILSTSPTTSAVSTTTEVPVPLWKYLESVGVTGEPVAPSSLTDLTVSIPTPPGWAPMKNPNITPNTEMIAKGESYPTAMLMVFKLHRDFDIAEALKHGTADARLSTDFTELDSSTADFNGFPSSMIQGSYDLHGRRLHTWNRIVFPTGAGQAALPGAAHHHESGQRGRQARFRHRGDHRRIRRRGKVIVRTVGAQLSEQLTRIEFPQCSSHGLA